MQVGFWRAHMGWFLTQRGFTPDLKYVKDLLKFRELRWLDRFDIAVPTVLGIGMFLLGVLLEKTAPHLHTNGWQMLIWGFFISTVLCYHGTYTINSLSHVFGRQRYSTGDTAATTGCWPSSRWAKAGTTITTTIPTPRARDSTGGKSTSATTY